MVKTILLKKVPKGTPDKSDFEFVDKDLPSLDNDQLLVKTLYISVDPYMRGKMSGTSTYTKPYKVGEALYGDGLAEVLESTSSKYKKGDLVVSPELPWAERAVVAAGKVNSCPPVDPEAALSCCGMTGRTAYLGLTEIGRPKEGEICVVSGAAGAVGHFVCQILKIFGCKVVGIAGGADKIKFLQTMGLDDVIDYKSQDIGATLKEKYPKGVNLYWDNVGGETLDAVVKNLATHGRVVNCGAISQYNLENPPQGPRLEGYLVMNRLRFQGFIVFDFYDKYDEATKKLVEWYQQGKLKKEITLRQNLEEVPNAFIDLFHGANKGKMLIKIAP